MIEAARRLPELRIVVNHLGRPPIPEQGWEPWASLVTAAAAHDNISMKLSIGLDIIVRWKWATEAGAALFRSRARLLRRRPRHGGEQLAGDPGWGELRRMLGGVDRLVRGLSDANANW